MGVKPDVELAKQCGLEIGQTGGIRVDDQMRTSDAAIFAVGDAVEVRDFVTSAAALSRWQDQPIARGESRPT